VKVLIYFCPLLFFKGRKKFNSVSIMFLEHLKSYDTKKGCIEVICGSMFSGKTEELIRRLKRARIAQQKVEIFKPRIDKRYDEINVVSHDSNFIPSTPVDSSSQILLMANDVEVVGVDEAQFFDDELPQVCGTLANRGIRVIVAGLDMDYLGKPFGPLPALMATAEYVTKVHAICMKCGNLANHSHRIVDNSSRILVGEKDSYEPLCRTCFNEERSKN
jgi:thymidine kinase